MPDAPISVKYGQCVGFFTALLADSDDPGNRPDMETLNGTITLEAVNLNYGQFPLTAPPMLALIKPVVLRVIDGYLMGAGNAPDAYVIATTQPNMSPSSFSWRATYNFEGIGRQPAPVIFTLGDGETKDLSQLIPADPEPGVIYTLANAMEYVKTINGVAPDIDGNVEVEGTGGGADTAFNLTGSWDFDDLPASVPGTMEVTASSAAPTTWTYLRFDEHDKNNVEFISIIMGMSQGGQILAQDSADASNWVLVKVTDDPLDSGSYITVPVEYVKEGGALDLSTWGEVFFAFSLSSDAPRTPEAVVATADTLVKRDGSGRTQVATPSVDADATPKSYVDGLITPLAEDVAELDSEVGVLQGAYVTLAGNMDNLFLRVNDHDTDIAGLDSRLDALEALNLNARILLLEMAGLDYVKIKYNGTDWPARPDPEDLPEGWYILWDSVMFASAPIPPMIDADRWDPHPESPIYDTLGS